MISKLFRNFWDRATSAYQKYPELRTEMIILPGLASALALGLRYKIGTCMSSNGDPKMISKGLVFNGPVNVFLNPSEELQNLSYETIIGKTVQNGVDPSKLNEALEASAQLEEQVLDKVCSNPSDVLFFGKLFAHTSQFMEALKYLPK